eukprot:CAMPEP_0174921946 /NCGR_PEP_ID=MMETSP1355-20121228/5513_1 /TAXON_ID=464990 /ORGANISM="Hemiselmis tepida, Strain CCMP443" /LENGTH=64 /DNA_ID=CAMNT_0016167481 /DNA_START=63 /DNA_END=253 /DNA_ORIENTATION=+
MSKVGKDVITLDDSDDEGVGAARSRQKLAQPAQPPPRIPPHERVTVDLTGEDTAAKNPPSNEPG